MPKVCSDAYGRGLGAVSGISGYERHPEGHLCVDIMIADKAFGLARSLAYCNDRAL